MTAYYNESDEHAAAWLRELIANGLIAYGDVDGRSIEDVTPGDLTGYTQCHFFAGIGVWSCALRKAGWPDDRKVWTGSCPCQPFSAAGNQAGFADERHLWPAWHWLISQCQPGILFGEQVANGADQWIDLVSTDLEGSGYAFGAVDIPACGVGAPHIRQRRWFVAERLADTDREGLERREVQPTRKERQAAERSGYVGGHWAGTGWVYCGDGKHRPVEPGSFPMADGAPERVVRLRGYGNAIVPQVAEQLVRAYAYIEGGGV